MSDGLNIIDLPTESKGCLCLVCEEVPASVFDRELGPVCSNCFGHALAAHRVMREVELSQWTAPDLAQPWED
jgi:hypothetical protein